MSEALRPRPPINADNRFYFDALDAGTVCAQCCDACGEFRHPPVPMCPRCHSLEWSPREMPGEGELVSFVVMHHPVRPPFEDGYIVALVEFPEGPRMVMNLEGIAEDDVKIGMTLRVAAEAVDDELTLPVARPIT
ncbi:Zn-ribbon domain-containing OB-fold protein [Tomitella fengzijianii]|uniref:DNA-binding protein n=1 Tax=Tomitella fengzijianii TaxID=2597660 RepID=A0A516X844_9ACTN|nr:OB-fold domain-containing protein [Tomitella fengzijianii]QDQ98811.1 hypothetical protein FO059_17525 [Tomitella fengzijianii]